MARSRDELVADFQGITAIDDVAEAVYHLEKANWDLLAAVNRVMPQDAVFNHQSNSDDVDVEMIDEDISVITPKSAKTCTSGTSHSFGPSTSCDDSPIRIMEFCIHFLDKKYDIEMIDTATVGDLRRRICDVTGVLPCRQILDGLGNLYCRNPLPNVTLSSLNLPSACDVFLNVPEENHRDDEVVQRLTQTYILNIDNEGHIYKLPFPGTDTVLQVKEGIFSLTNINVRHQIWTGWPAIPDLDSKKLALIGLSYPEHYLKVEKSIQKMSPKHHKQLIEDSDSSESDEYEDYSAIDDGFTIKKDEPLISDNIGSEIAGAISFANGFKKKYGSDVPLFFQGSLDDALKESCLKPARDRRLLGIYLHHQESILTNIFCSQILIKESVQQVLAANFIVYGWDLTFESNKNVLLTSVSNALGNQASTTVKNMSIDKLPILIIVMRIRSSTEISIIDGNVSLEELVGKLIEAVDMWSSSRDEEIREEEKRAVRELIKQKQDEEYNASLNADRAKEELKKEQKMAKDNEMQQVEIRKQEEKARKEARQQEAIARLPSEPESGDNVKTVRFKLPENKSLKRRFSSLCPISGLLDFLTAEGYPSEEYKVIKWLQTDLTSVDSQLTLQDLQFAPQESVHLEARSFE